MDQENKEFSVDIQASCSVPRKSDGVEQDEWNGDIQFFIECKFRDENKKWVFLPDSNPEEYASFDFSLGHTIRCLEEFSLVSIDPKPLHDFEETLPCGLKGTEINTLTGDVQSKDILHGFNQLKYGLPSLLKGEILNSLNSHKDDNIPTFIVPILVTNADLFLLNNDFGIEKVINADSIEELGFQVPYLCVYQAIGPDFKNHNQEVFKSFQNNLALNKLIKPLDEVRAIYKNGEYDYYVSPIKTCNGLIKSSSHEMDKYYTHFLVCSIDHLEDLLDKVISNIEIVCNTAEKKYT
jgi:hypothetical protein